MLSLFRLILLNLSLACLYVSYSYLIRSKQFYQICINLAHHSVAIKLLHLNSLLFSILCYRYGLKIMFGQLRPIELDHLDRHQWFLFIELTSTFTLLQPTFTQSTYWHLGFLFFLTLTHRLLAKRIEQINRPQQSPNHIRLIGIKIILLLINVNQIYRSTINVFDRYRGKNFSRKHFLLSLLFLLRYILCQCLWIQCLVDYCLNTIDRLLFDNDWHEKIFLSTISNLITKTAIVCCQTFVWFTFFKNGLRSIAMLRYIIKQFESLLQISTNLIRSYRTLDRMYRTFPIPQSNQLVQPCPICLEEMIDNNLTRKSLNCRHMFHLSCLKRWIRNRQDCPVCRVTL